MKNSSTQIESLKRTISKNSNQPERFMERANNLFFLFLFYSFLFFSVFNISVSAQNVPHPVSFEAQKTTTRYVNAARYYHIKKEEGK